MKKESLWEQEIKQEKIKELNEDIETDILIIGGGITGSSIAYELKELNKKITIVEASLVGMGVTKNTTGKINYLQETIYSDLTKKYSLAHAKKYLTSQLSAIKELTNVIKKEKINCNLEKVESFVYANEEKEIPKLKQEKKILETLGVLVKEQTEQFLYALSVEDTYVFHPIKYLYALKEILIRNNIEIYEKTKIVEVKKEKENFICLTEKNKINAQKVILACHYPFFTMPFLMPLKATTEKSYIAALEEDKIEAKTYITSKNPCTSIRYHQDKEKYLIYLRNSHNISNHLNEKENFKNLLDEIPEEKVKFLWSNDDLITFDKMPYIGKIKKEEDHLLLATGFNTWGMTNSVLSGLIIKDILLNKENEWTELMSPLRTNSINHMKEYTKNTLYSLKSFIGNKIIKNKDWYENVVYTKKNGKNVAIYNDGKRKYIVYSTCPHLGCTLIFNEIEKTWDCPCHASRFSLEGKCIKGPSRYDIKYKEK